MFLNRNQIQNCQQIFCLIFFLKVTYSTLSVKELWKTVYTGQSVDLKDKTGPGLWPMIMELSEKH